MYNCFEFNKDKDNNIYMSPELFICYFKSDGINLNARKSNTFGIALLSSSFICSLEDR